MVFVKTLPHTILYSVQLANLAHNGFIVVYLREKKKVCTSVGQVSQIHTGGSEFTISLTDNVFPVTSPSSTKEYVVMQ